MGDGSGRLKTLVAGFATAADPAVRLTLIDQILFVWTEQSGQETEHRSSLCPRKASGKFQVLSVQILLPAQSGRMQAMHCHPGGAPCKQETRKPHPDYALGSRRCQRGRSEWYAYTSKSPAPWTFFVFTMAEI